MARAWNKLLSPPALRLGGHAWLVLCNLRSFRAQNGRCMVVGTSNCTETASSAKSVCAAQNNECRPKREPPQASPCCCQALRQILPYRQRSRINPRVEIAGNSSCLQSNRRPGTESVKTDPCRACAFSSEALIEEIARRHKSPCWMHGPGRNACASLTGS